MSKLMGKLIISKVFENLLKKNKVSLRAVSKGTKVPVSSLSEWKKNNRNPNAEHVARVADFFGCSVHYLLFGDEDPSEPMQKILKEEFFKGTFEVTLKRVKVDGDNT